MDTPGKKVNDASPNNGLKSNLNESITNSPQDDRKLKANNPNRVIKKIVMLDQRKLKELGIESNILSAMTKISGEHCFTCSFQCLLNISEAEGVFGRFAILINRLFPFGKI